MQRKLLGYFFLSFLSFCFFTVIFHMLATAHASTGQPVLQNSVVANPIQSIPTPTIYNTQFVLQHPQAQQSAVPSPTPTIYNMQSQSTPSLNSLPTIAPTQNTPTPTVIPPTSTPAPTVQPTAEPTTAPVTDLDTLFSKYSAVYSVSESELKKIAFCESGFNAASNAGAYEGMFQFSANTWSSVRTSMGLDPNPDLRSNAEEAIKTAAFMLSHGEQNAWPNCH